MVAKLRTEKCHLPVIIKGAFLIGSHRSRIDELRIQAIFEKPFDILDLQDALNRCGSS